MNSSERIRAVVEHREPDRVPLHINASKWVVDRMLLSTDLRDHKELLDYLHIDVYDTRGIDLHTGTTPSYIGPPHRILEKGKSWGGNIMALWNIREYEKESSHGFTLEIENPPLLNVLLEDMASFPWPESGWFDFTDMREDLKKWNSFSIMASGGSVFQHASYLTGLDIQLIELLTDPQRSNYTLDKLLEFYLAYYEKMFTEAGDLIDVLALADDFGTQDSLLISPETFDNYFAHRIKKMADLAHKYNSYLLLHTCGNIEPLIPRFIELGVDILDPIQPESLDPSKIKKKYGSEICLRGGISSQQILAHGSRQDVENEVKQKLEQLMPGGGYILSPGHPVLQVDIPVENILTMYQTAYNYGKY